MAALAYATDRNRCRQRWRVKIENRHRYSLASSVGKQHQRPEKEAHTSAVERWKIETVESCCLPSFESKQSTKDLEPTARKIGLRWW
ncbi:hypothetical protein LINPERHAP1_LOCUS17325 [Linum perenne]